jgi:hypothetical protein
MMLPIPPANSAREASDARPAARRLTLSLACSLVLLAALLPRTVLAATAVAAPDNDLIWPLQVATGSPDGSPFPADEPAAPTDSEATPPRKQVSVRRGDTLDIILRAHLKPAPEALPALRRQVMQMNPEAFPGGRPERLRLGATLTLPTSTASASPDARHGEPGDPRPVQQAPQVPQAAEAAREGWIRYP